MTPFIDTLQIALLYSIPVLAVVLAFRIVGFPDLTPDGSFTIGAAVAGRLVLEGWPFPLAAVAAILAGATAGALTAILHTQLRISKLLCGILVVFVLYSLALRTMGTSNLSLLGVGLSNHFWGTEPGLGATLFPIVSSGAPILLVLAFLGTPLGLRLRATGDSDTAMEHRGLTRRPYYLAGLVATNAIAAWGGVCVSQYQGFADVSMGTGVVVTSLAALVIGESVLRPERVSTLLGSAVLGMTVYQGIVAVALRLGLPPADLKVATAVLALVFVGFDRIRSNRERMGRQIGNRSF